MNLAEFLKSATEEMIRGNGNNVATLKANEQQCPKCGKVYTFSKPRGEGTATEKEQHISGICSDKCWDDALGPEPYKKA